MNSFIVNSLRVLFISTAIVSATGCGKSNFSGHDKKDAAKSSKEEQKLGGEKLGADCYALGNPNPYPGQNPGQNDGYGGGKGQPIPPQPTYEEPAYDDQVVVVKKPCQP